MSNVVKTAHMVSDCLAKVCNRSTHRYVHRKPLTPSSSTYQGNNDDAARRAFRCLHLEAVLWRLVNCSGEAKIAALHLSGAATP